MAIPDETKERIRQAADIADIVGMVVPLKPSGANLRGLSPFNKEKTPSFYVFPHTQTFKCFSSGHQGDVFKFVMLYESLDFPSAIRRLAEQVGIEIIEEYSPGQREARKGREEMLSLHAELSLYWRDLLLHDQRAQPARDYMRHRQIPMSWVKEFGLGYAPDAWDDTVNWARKNRFSKQCLIDSGVVKEKQGGGRIYDFFRGRLIFPINNEQGHPIAFSGRLLDSEAKAAKYINSPETMIFSKGKVLFGYDRAKRAVIDEDKAIICEGQVDVLRCHAVGIKNVIAPLGTGFTADHAKALRRCTRNITICLDADRAGRQAAERAARMFVDGMDGMDALMHEDIGIQVAELPEGHDPDSIIVENGADAFRVAMGKTVEFIDFYVRLLLDGQEGSLSGKRRAAEQAAEFIAKIPSRMFREQLIHRAVILLGTSAQAFEEQVEKVHKSQRKFRDQNARIADQARPSSYQGGGSRQSNQRHSLSMGRKPSGAGGPGGAGSSSGAGAQRPSQSHQSAESHEFAAEEVEIYPQEMGGGGAPLSYDEEGVDDTPAVPMAPLKPHALMAQLIQISVSQPECIPDLQRRLSPLWCENKEGAELLFQLMEIYSADEWESLPAVVATLDTPAQDFINSLDVSLLKGHERDEVLKMQGVICEKLDVEWSNQRMRNLSQLLADSNLEQGERVKLIEEVKSLEEAKRERMTRASPKKF